MKDLLAASFAFALERTHPTRLTAAHLPSTPPDLVLSVGKAALTMLQAVLERWPHVPYFATPKAQSGIPPSQGNGEIWPASHPLPSSDSLNAAKRALELAAALTPTNHLLLLVSGGGSALWCAPRVSFSAKQQTTQALLAAGASIQEINAVRKHLSWIKGGQLALATPAHITALLLSDVPGDDLAVIASGPTVPDPTTFAQALEVLQRYEVQQPEATRYLQLGAQGQHPETAKAHHGAFAKVHNELIGSNQHFLHAVNQFLQSRGYHTHILSDRLQGDAKGLAQQHAQWLQHPKAPVLISGGEASVKVSGSGQGGRNQEFVAWLGQLCPRPLWALAADTDGIDGNSPAAGAFLTPTSQQRAQGLGLSWSQHLQTNNTFGLFSALGDSFVTGETHNNLNDCRIMVLADRPG